MIICPECGAGRHDECVSLECECLCVLEDATLDDDIAGYDIAGYDPADWN